MLNAVDDSPDPCSPPVSGPAAISGTFTFSGTGPDVENAVVTEQALLRMTVVVTGPVGQTFLSATASASRNPGDPSEITKTLTVYWVAAGLPDGLYTYTVSGQILQFHQNHRGQNTGPQEFVKATSGTLSGTILVDATPPAISDLNPPDGGFTGESQPAISASFSDSGSGIALASLDVKLDSWPVPQSAWIVIGPTGFSFVPEYPLAGGVHTVTVSLADYAGNTASVSWSFTAGDSIPPEVTPPQDVVAEAEFEAGAYVSYPPATATDNVTGDPVITYSQASGTLFPLGVTTVVVTATDAAGNIGSATFQVAVQDTTPPVIYPPGDLVIEATSCDGALVYYSDAYAWDAVTSWPVLYYSQPSGTLFPIAATTVYITATDAAGNTSSATFQVAVQDTTPPVITQPDDMLVEASSPEGATVWFPYPTVYDAVTAWPAVTFDPPSGAIFQIAVTTVTITATDAAGNSSNTTLRVVVQDTTPPSVMTQGLITVEADAAGGALVSLPAPLSVYDAVTPDPAITYDPPSGSFFPLGTTVVTVFATDAAGNIGSSTLWVTVQDTTPPVITIAPEVIAEATGPEGAVVNYPYTVDDIATGVAWITFWPEDGSTFLLGTTPFCAITACDNAGNYGYVYFDVTVRDTTPPVVTPPAHMLVEANRADGADNLSYGPASATDAVTPNPTIAFSPPSEGTVFPFGVTTVTASAADSSGNTGTATFTVTVFGAPEGIIYNLTPPHGSAVSTARPLISAAIAFPDAAVNWSSLFVTLDGEAVDVTLADGGFFYIPSTDLSEGWHVVTVDVEDEAGNGAAALWMFQVDLVAPVITNLSPAPDSTVDLLQPFLSANFMDPGSSGIDPSSVQVFADFEFYTFYADESGFCVAPVDALTTGSHTVTVQVSDYAGNLVVREWQFTVSETARGPIFKFGPTVPIETGDEKTPPGEKGGEPPSDPIPILEKPPGEHFPYVPFVFQSITFGDTIPLKDDHGQAYYAPQWRDGDVYTESSHELDRNWPVAYAAGNTMKVTATLCTIHDDGAAWRITGRGPDNLVIKTGVVVPVVPVVPPDTHHTVNLAAEAEEPFEALRVRYYDPMEINWYCKPAVVGEEPWGAWPDGQWFTTTVHRVYITHKPPDGSPSQYRTVIHIGCDKANGLTDEKPIVDAIWGEFSDRTVSTWNSSIDILTYQQSVKAETVEELLRAGDGKCRAWALFFRDCLNVQGIQATRTRILPRDDYRPPEGVKSMKPEGILVREWDMTPVTQLPPGEPIRATPMDAQGGPDPKGSYKEHALVVHGSRYYDPSYGTAPVPDLLSWQKNALSAGCWTFEFYRLNPLTGKPFEFPNYLFGQQLNQLIVKEIRD